jgi:hypothetical protein
MDPLQQLWDLYEEVMEKPPLMDTDSPTMGVPEDPEEEPLEHPIVSQRRKVDGARAMGLPPEQAHEKAYGEVDLGDSDSKAEMAATLGRVQNDGMRNAVRIDKDSETPSLLAKDEILQQQQQVSPLDFKTGKGREVPNSIQPQDQSVEVGEQVEIVDVWNYNDDVAYLQKYGRA